MSLQILVSPKGWLFDGRAEGTLNELARETDQALAHSVMYGVTPTSSDHDICVAIIQGAPYYADEEIPVLPAHPHCRHTYVRAGVNTHRSDAVYGDFYQAEDSRVDAAKLPRGLAVYRMAMQDLQEEAPDIAQDTLARYLPLMNDP